MSRYRRRYYLAFTFQGRPDLHCTHCYFGERGRAMMGSVVCTVDQFFKDRGMVMMPAIHFNKVDRFETDGARILVASDHTPFEIFKPLREEFASHNIINHRYFPYRAHILTEKLTELKEHFNYYSLFRGPEVVRSWKLYPKADD